ncbi:MAG: glycoside hydrolase family 38 C-terminal domain-containing protein [Atribacterota bacterium]|nr:glycoside hydrolase family 38 C-terminal domain-containing protein [Atribacterota bacterium]
MSEVINAHIISHTHWDREWFLDSKYTTEWLIPFFDSLFRLLKKESNYKFVLDGQTLIIEDYFDQLKRQGKNSGEYKRKLKQYVQEGRLLVGPYYLQPDWQLVSGESLVRNLLIGCKIGEKLGGLMKVGWLLDNFGQISQTVQIHKKFNIEGLFLWRGVGVDSSRIHSEFLWESPDGTRLTSIYLLSSYRNAMRLGGYKEIMKERIENEVRKIYPFAATPNVLLMNGYDQEMTPDDFLPELKKIVFSDIQVKQSTPEEYLEAVRKNSPKLKVLKGALYNGRLISVFPGTLSSRIYLKCMNDICQRELEKYAEPISILSWLNGGKYNSNVLMAVWKKLLKNHPHDSICGVSIDDVHIDMEKRFSEVIASARKITEDGLRELVLNIDTSSCPQGAELFIIFNPSLKTRDKIITIKTKGNSFKIIDSKGRILANQKGNKDHLHIYADNIPALGYKTIYLRAAPGKYTENQTDIPSDKVIVKENMLENRYLQVEIKENGSLDVFDKMNKCWYKNLNMMVDGADAGDEYNYSFPENDLIITNQKIKAEMEVVERSWLKAVIKVSLILPLPESLTDDRKTRSSKLKDFPLVNWLTLEADSPILGFRTEVKNTVKDHRLRVLFPTSIDTEFSFAGTQFDVAKRKIVPEAFDDRDISEEVKRVIIGAREPQPITTFPHGYFVDINDGKRGVAVLNKGLPEYEILSDNHTIALTLFRSVGWLTRGDLLTRMGDAGPVIFTPDAQCLRRMTFKYAIYFHQGDHHQARVYQMAEEFNTDLKTVKTDQHQGELADTAGFLTLKSTKDTLQVSAIKRAEEGEGVILRLFNPSKETIGGEVISNYNLGKVYLVNLNEKIIREIKDCTEKRFKLWIKPKEIVTINLEIVRKNILKKRIKAKKIKIQCLSEEDYPMANFDSFRSTPLLTGADIASEEKRLKGIEKKLNKARKTVSLLEDKFNKFDGLDSVRSDEIEFEFHKAKGEVKTYYRAFLEAKLSLVLSQKKYLETYHKDVDDYTKSMEEIEETLREIGYKLNEARVKKRAYEYIVEYYQHRLEFPFNTVSSAKHH